MSKLNGMEKLLDLPADQASGVEVEWKATGNGEIQKTSFHRTDPFGQKTSFHRTDPFGTVDRSKRK